MGILQEVGPWCDGKASSFCGYLLLVTCKIIYGTDYKKAVVLAGISMEGDDELLADMDVKVAPKRDEWMTTLPPERKVRPSSFNCHFLIFKLTTSAFVISCWDLGTYCICHSYRNPFFMHNFKYKNLKFKHVEYKKKF